MEVRLLGGRRGLDQLVLFRLPMPPEAFAHPSPRSPSHANDASGVRIPILPDFLEPEAPLDPFLQATLASERRAVPGADLAGIWQSVLDRRLTLCAQGETDRDCYMIARVTRDEALPSSPLSRIETAVLVRVLKGEQQKLVAAELSIACSTASKWYTSALDKTGLSDRPIPVAMVIAAQAWASGKTPPVLARSSTFEHGGLEYCLVAVPRPVVGAQGSLTPAECEVARYLVEGESRWEIATRRDTSAQTVACQIRGIFSKWKLTGRYALIQRAVELGWFL